MAGDTCCVFACLLTGALGVVGSKHLLDFLETSTPWFNLLKMSAMMKHEFNVEFKHTGPVQVEEVKWALQNPDNALPLLRSSPIRDLFECTSVSMIAGGCAPNKSKTLGEVITCITQLPDDALPVGAFILLLIAVYR